MPTIYNEANINCPFYQRSATQSISCEGISDKCTLKILFDTPNDMHNHRSEHCENQYKKCEIYKLLEKKYE